MTKTQFYNLNNWSIDDRVLHTDFNADNAAIDAALHAVDEQAASAVATANTVSGSIDSKISQTRAYAQSLVPIVKLVDVTNYGDTKQWDLNLTSLAWSQYAEIIIYAKLKTPLGGNYLSVRVNNDKTTNRYRCVENPNGMDCLTSFKMSEHAPSTLLMRCPSMEKSICATSVAVTAAGEDLVRHTTVYYSPDGTLLLNFCFEAGLIGAGSRAIVYGVKL